mmetsp:Transcript_72006/g.154082  ORF Transcript_72006/g.154082 Transcript_72006/m.154082 type:complete len:229 (+) Transcript_72006:1659-2345(+)
MADVVASGGVRFRADIAHSRKELYHCLPTTTPGACVYGRAINAGAWLPTIGSGSLQCGEGLLPLAHLAASADSSDIKPRLHVYYALRAHHVQEPECLLPVTPPLATAHQPMQLLRHHLAAELQRARLLACGLADTDCGLVRGHIWLQTIHLHLLPEIEYPRPHRGLHLAKAHRCAIDSDIRLELLRRHPAQELQALLPLFAFFASSDRRFVACRIQSHFFELHLPNQG